jgi:hypothetical protein
MERNLTKIILNSVLKFWKKIFSDRQDATQHFGEKIGFLN